MMIKKLLGICAFLLAPLSSQANNFTLPLPGDALVGSTHTAYLKHGEDLAQLGRKYNAGYYEMLEANPHVNPEKVYPWQALTIPGQFILPDAPHEGIVINLAELRVYYYPENSNQVYTYPAGIGMQGWQTPTGQFTVIERMDHPNWYVPASVQKSMAKQGVYLPKVMNAGPDNPLGEYALRLSERTYLLHGTNVPATVGRRASAGCLHLYPENIKALYEMVPEGTQVTIVDQPFKAGWAGNTLYFQATQPLHEDQVQGASQYKSISTQVIKQALAEKNSSAQIDWNQVNTIVAQHDGMPHPIATNV